MLNSNVSSEQMEVIMSLVPDAADQINEYWRIVPNTVEGSTYIVSSKRDILIRYDYISSRGTHLKPVLITMSLDGCVYNTSIRRSDKKYSTYIEHVRYDAFPELNVVKSLDDDLDDTICVPYDYVDWYGRRKEHVYIIPVSDSDMEQVRKFYPEDLPREMWAYVPGTNRKYVVSSQSRGVILKRYRSTGTILKAQKWQLKSGKKIYYECCLTVGDHQLNSVSHPHILRSFIPKPSDEHEVNHIDGDPHNNVLDNLEWVTRQENSDHYNKSPEMEYKRKIGYAKISEFGRLHQKEIQNNPETNAKRSATLKKRYAEARRRAALEQYINSIAEKGGSIDEDKEDNKGAS